MYKQITISIFFLSISFFGLSAQKTASIPKPNPAQLRWSEAELGVVFHYDLHVFDNKKYNQTANRIEPVPDYNMFNPEALDTDQWVRAAKAAGARFAIITATHETGFAIYQSDVNPYCLKALKWRDGKGDIVGDFVKSCRKYGILPGIYIGIRWNSLLGVHNFKVEGDGEFAQRRQAWYKRYCENLTKELCTKYGELFMIWFDGGADDPAGLGPDVEPIVNKYQPNCLFYHNARRADLRWGGSETGTVGYPCWSTFPNPFSHKKELDRVESHNQLLKHGDPDGKYWVPAMADAPLRGYNGRHEWFWEPDDDDAVEPLHRLVNMYYQSVGRNATLILGLTPDPRGLIPDVDVARLSELGEHVRQLTGKPLAETRGKGKHIVLNLGKKTVVNQVIIQENIADGQRVRGYRVQGRTTKGWKTLCEGTSIGHKRIETFTSTSVRALRLIIDESVGIPDIKSFKGYHVDLSVLQ